MFRSVSARNQRLLRSFAALLLALLLPGAALASAFTFTFPLTRDGTDPCTGETVVLQGTAHQEINVTASSSGNYTAGDTSKVSLKGVAPVSGAQYVGEDQSSFSNTGPLPMEITSVQSVLMIRQGETLPADDFYQFVKVHMTVNANGVPTADVSMLNAQCK
jgi:hypothetical protein